MGSDAADRDPSRGQALVIVTTDFEASPLTEEATDLDFADGAIVLDGMNQAMAARFELFR